MNLWLERFASEHTRTAYRHDAGLLLAWAVQQELRIEEIGMVAFAEFVAWLKATKRPVAAQRAVQSVRSFFRFLCRAGILRFNPADATPPVKSIRRTHERYLTREQVLRLFIAVDEKERTWVRLAYALGLRVGEVCGLKWSDFSDRGDRIAVLIHGKGAKDRIVTVGGEIAQNLRLQNGWVSRYGWVAPHRGTQPPSRRRLERVLERASKKAGLPHVVPHALRHAHVTHAIEGGAPIPLVQATVGHASLASTQVYAHANPSASSADYIRL